MYSAESANVGPVEASFIHNLINLVFPVRYLLQLLAARLPHLHIQHLCVLDVLEASTMDFCPPIKMLLTVLNHLPELLQT